MCIQLARELSSFVGESVDVDAAFPFAHFDDRKVMAERIADLNISAISNTFASLKVDRLYSMAKGIREKKSVTLYAMEENVLPAQDFADKLLSIGINVRTAFRAVNVTNCALTQTADSPALLISYYHKEQVIQNAARSLCERKVPVYLICGPFTSGLTKYASETAEIGFYESQPRIGPIGSRTATCAVLDVLYAYVFNQDYEKNVALMNNGGDYRKYGSENG